MSAQAIARGDTSDKRTLAIMGAALTIATSIVTYTITVTMLYAGIQQDLALLMQRQELQQRADEMEHAYLKGRIDYLSNLTGDLQRQLDRNGSINR